MWRWPAVLLALATALGAASGRDLAARLPVESPVGALAPLLDDTPLALTADFASGSLQGLQREPDGALALAATALLPPEQRPRAYAAYAAVGQYTSPVLELPRPVTHIEATLDAQLAPDAQLLVEVRGRTAEGRWTPWTEVEPGGPAAALDAPAVALAYRLTLLADTVGAAGPRVRAVQLRARTDRWRLLQRAAAASYGPPTLRVWATREGLVGARTANGHLIEPNDRFVALPSRRVLNPLDSTEYTVTIHYKGRTATAPVWDIGPWNVRDNYWDPSRELFADLPRWLPQAQAAFFYNHNQGRDQFGRFVTLPAALDIADGTFWEDLGMTHNDWVEVTFNWLDAPSPPWVAPVTVVPKPTPTPVPKPKGESYNAPAAAPRLYLPVVLRAFEGWTSTIVIQNPNASATTGTIELYNRDGSLQDTLAFTLPPWSTATYTPAAFAGLPARFAGAGIITASQPVAAVVHENHVEQDRMSYPAQTAPASTLYVPLVIKDLNTWDTILHVQNVGSTPAEVRVTYYPTGGAGPTWTDTATIPPLGARAFSQFNHPQLPAGFVGSAVITSPNGGQLAAIVNEVKTEGAAVSYPVPAGGAPDVLVPFVARDYQGWSTGLQVQNLGSAATTVTVTYLRSNGPGTWTESATIPPGAAAVFYQPANAQLPAGFLGMAHVASSDGAPLAVLVNLINPQSTAAMNYLASAAGSPVLALPYVARQAEGWSTNILVYNPNSVPAVVSIVYYDSNGSPLAREEEAIPAGGTRSFFQQRQAALPDGFLGSALVQSVTGSPLVAVVNAVYSP